MNTPVRGNKYLLFVLLYQFAMGFLIPLLERLIGISFFNSQMSIVPLHIILFIIPFIIYLLFTSQSISEVLPIRKINFTNIGLILLMCITIQPLMMVLSGLSTLLFPNNVSVVLSELYAMPLIVVILATSLTPAITEEITMRGIVLTNYENVPIRKAALINGILFGIIHLDLQQFFYAFLLGFMFAYFVYYTKSIFASVIAHFFINFIQTSLAFISFNMLESAEAAKEAVEKTSNADLMSVIVSLSVIALVFTPVCIVIFRAFAYYNKQRMVTEALDTGGFEPVTENLSGPETILDSEQLDTHSDDNISESLVIKSQSKKVYNWPLAVIIIIYISYITLTLLK